MNSPTKASEMMDAALVIVGPNSSMFGANHPDPGLKTLPIPLIVSKDGNTTEIGLGTIVNTPEYTAELPVKIDIVNGDHPLAAGLMGTVGVLTTRCRLGPRSEPRARRHQDRQLARGQDVLGHLRLREGRHDGRGHAARRPAGSASSGTARPRSPPTGPSCSRPPWTGPCASVPDKLCLARPGGGMLGGREAAGPLFLDMPRFVRPLFALCLLMAGCKATTGETPPIPTDRTGGVGGSRTGGSGGVGHGGQRRQRRERRAARPRAGPVVGRGAAAPRAARAALAPAGPLAAAAAAAASAPAAAVVPAGQRRRQQDAPVTADAAPFRDSGGEAGTVESDHLPGRPDLKICKKEWTPEQCCAFLCSCLVNICSDSPKGKPGIATCMNWCPKLGDMARRCHVYHCYVSISPTGGIKDHDSHCGHAADQVAGGGCPVEVYK